MQVIDKALLDAVLCGEDALGRAGSMVKEMHRVLKPGGTYIVISYGPPATRLGYLTQDGTNWHPTVIEIPRPRISASRAGPGTGVVLDATATASPCFFMYVMTKSE
jgi:hypothetical protein